jgi:lipopolysaccharide transport system permease protein/teichoic acid transport system permease protein
MWLPYITLMQLCFCTAIAIGVSYVSVFVRDIDGVVGHILRIWFFGSPVIWSEELLEERSQWIVAFNPMAHFLAAYRAVILRQTNPEVWTLLLIGSVSALAVACLTYYFSQHEHKIIKAL